MKKILFLFAALIAAMPLMAQSEDGDELKFSADKKNAIFIGPKAGVTINTMSQPDEGDLYDKSGIGFSAGLAAKARFGRATGGSPAGSGWIGLGLEVKYRQSSVKTFGTDQDGKENADLKLGYLDIPVSLQVYPFPKVTKELYIEAGACFSMLLSRSPETLTVTNPSGDYSKVVYNIDSDASKLKGGAVNPFIGVGYTIPNSGLGLNARYNIGASKLAGNFPCKISAIEVSFSWMFNVGQF
ncbi:MAG: PorT family protein [Bacteroidales bacterium]|nr:PorT family protein [Bacteroidales bacterium]